MGVRRVGESLKDFHPLVAQLALVFVERHSEKGAPRNQVTAEEARVILTAVILTDSEADTGVGVLFRGEYPALAEIDPGQPSAGGPVVPGLQNGAAPVVPDRPARNRLAQNPGDFAMRHPLVEQQKLLARDGEPFQRGSQFLAGRIVVGGVGEDGLIETDRVLMPPDRGQIVSELELDAMVDVPGASVIGVPANEGSNGIRVDLSGVWGGLSCHCGLLAGEDVAPLRLMIRLIGAISASERPRPNQDDDEPAPHPLPR